MDFGGVSSLSGIKFDLPPDGVLLYSKQRNEEKSVEVFTGCPIWSHPGWRGKVYPKGTPPGDFLKYYAKCFSSIELNSSFYHLPNLETVKKWQAVVSKDFKFCPKIPKLISHEHLLDDVDDLIKLSCETFRWMKPNFGVAFLQLPPSFGFEKIDRLSRFIGVWDEELPLAIEFRHPSWFEKGQLVTPVFELMKEAGVCPVITDTPGRRDVVHMSLTSDSLMVRFLGHRLDKSDLERLEEWANRLRPWMETQLSQVYFFLHQPDDDLAPETVVEFIEILNRVCDLCIEVPVLSDWEDQQTLF